MESQLAQTRRVPRVIPTRERLAAVVGIWELNGEMIRMLKEPGTGVLVAVNDRGWRVNPVQVISQGRKMGETP